MRQQEMLNLKKSSKQVKSITISIRVAFMQIFEPLRARKAGFFLNIFHNPFCLRNKSSSFTRMYLMQAKFVLNLLSYDEEGNKKISCTPRVFYEELNSHKFYRTKREKWDVAGVKNIGK